MSNRITRLSAWIQRERAAERELRRVRLELDKAYEECSAADRLIAQQRADDAEAFLGVEARDGGKVAASCPGEQ